MGFGGGVCGGDDGREANLKMNAQNGSLTMIGVCVRAGVIDMRGGGRAWLCRFCW